VVLDGLRRGLPFGQDPLLVLWLVAAFYAAGKPADNVLRFRSPLDILAVFQLEPALFGPEWPLYRLLCVLGMRGSIQEAGRRKRGRLFFRSYQVADGVQFYFPDKDNELARQRALWSYRVELSRDFAEDLRKHAIPIHLDHIRALKEAPAALDLYVFQAWRSHWLALTGDELPLLVPVFEVGGLLSKLGALVTDPSEAKKLLRDWHAQVCAAWPDCPNELTDDATVLLVRPRLVVDPKADLVLPGVEKFPPPPNDPDPFEL
jgi:hypothetical protein